MKFWKQCTAGVLCLALAIGMGAALSGCSQSSSDTAAARMQVDINPSVEFILDSENKVLSVTALNDDGALIVAGEAFIGKTAEDAVALMAICSKGTQPLTERRSPSASRGTQTPRRHCMKAYIQTYKAF